MSRPPAGPIGMLGGQVLMHQAHGRGAIANRGGDPLIEIIGLLPAWPPETVSSSTTVSRPSDAA